MNKGSTHGRSSWGGAGPRLHTLKPASQGYGEYQDNAPYCQGRTRIQSARFSGWSPPRLRYRSLPPVQSLASHTTRRHLNFIQKSLFGSPVLGMRYTSAGEMSVEPLAKPRASWHPHGGLGLPLQRKSVLTPP